MKILCHRMQKLEDKRLRIIKILAFYRFTIHYILWKILLFLIEIKLKQFEDIVRAASRNHRVFPISLFLIQILTAIVHHTFKFSFLCFQWDTFKFF